MLKNKFYLLFLVAAIALVFSCKKDDFTDLIKEDAKEIVDFDYIFTNSSSFAHGNSNCTDDIEQESVNYAMRSYIKKLIDLDITGPEFKNLGKPFYPSIITDVIDEESRETYAVSYVPLIDQNKELIKSILIFYTTQDGSEYVLLNRNDIQDSEPFSVTFELEGSTIIKRKNDFLEIFDLFDYYYNCQNQQELARMPIGWAWWRKLFKLGPPCPSAEGGNSTRPPGQGFGACLSNVFGGGHETITNFIFISGFDVGFPWGSGQGGISNFPPNIVGNPGNGPSNPAFLDAILLLQMNCNNSEADPDGAGLDVGVIEEEVLNPTALAILEQWCYFKDKCIADEFSGFQPLPVPINSNNNAIENPYYKWGEFFSSDSQLFLDIIHSQYGCVSHEDFELVECVAEGYDDFVASQNLALSEDLEKYIKKSMTQSGECSSVVDFLDHVIQSTECGQVLNNLIEELNLTLTPAQQLNLVMLGGSVGNMCGENSNFEDLVAENIHNTLLETNEDYANANFDFDKFKEECGTENYLKAVAAFEDMPDTEEFVPLITYTLKKLAEFGAGALIDFSMQIGIEYVIGDHSSFEEAWNNADINKFTIFSSGLEAICRNKYVGVGGSIAADLLNYVTTTDEVTSSGLAQAFGTGAISGILGAYAGDLIHHFGKVITKYGPEQTIRKLKDLGDFNGAGITTSVYQQMLKIKDFRDFMIDSVWDVLEPKARGFLMEEILSSNRYANFNWVNEAGELSGPLDFILDNFGIQLKTSQNAALTGTGWSAIRKHAKDGLDQILKAINAGDITGGRVDIMIPKEFEHLIPELLARLRTNLELDVPGSDYFGLEIDIFVE